MKNTLVLLLLVCCTLSFSSCAWLLAMTLGMNNSNDRYEKVPKTDYYIEDDVSIEEDIVGGGPPPPEPRPEEEPPPPPPTPQQPAPRINTSPTITGPISMKLTAAKMNVFYIGVDNPIAVNALDVPNNQLRVACSGCQIMGSNGKYIVRVVRPGACQITVTTNKGDTKNFDFRSKRLPDPVPVLGSGYSKRGGSIGNGEFKAQQGVLTILEYFDFDAKCVTTRFGLTRISKTDDLVSVLNIGARYVEEAKSLVATAKPGDTYIIDDIRCKCPGDAADRALPPLVFNIK